jgi:hypothetical protein
VQQPVEQEMRAELRLLNPEWVPVRRLGLSPAPDGHPRAIQANAERMRLLLASLIYRINQLFARNFAFLAALMESRLRLQAVDLPAADEFTLHIMAAVAQKEALATSTRTRDALAANKARGAQLGTPANLTQAAREKSWVMMTQNAQANLNNRQAAN